MNDGYLILPLSCLLKSGSSCLFQPAFSILLTYIFDILRFLDDPGCCDVFSDFLDAYTLFFLTFSPNLFHSIQDFCLLIIFLHWLILVLTEIIPTRMRASLLGLGC